MDEKLLAQYTPRKRSWFFVRAMGMICLGVLALALYRFFTVGGFARADLFKYPVLLAVGGFFTLVWQVVKNKPRISAYETGLQIGRASVIRWSQMKSVRYWRGQDSESQFKHEWTIQTKDRKHVIRSGQPDDYITPAHQLNELFIANVKDFAAGMKIA